MIAPHPYSPVGERVVQGEEATLDTVGFPSQTEREVVCFMFVLFTFCHVSTGLPRTADLLAESWDDAG